jgi:hypothetical protein
MAKNFKVKVKIPKISKKDILKYLDKKFREKWKAFLKFEQLKFDCRDIRMLGKIDNQDTILFSDMSMGCYVRITISDKKFFKRLCKAFPEATLKSMSKRGTK